MVSQNGKVLYQFRVFDAGISFHNSYFSLVRINGIGVHLVAHGRVVTSSRQINEVKQRQTRLVLGWVTGARVTLLAMCRGVGQASHIKPPLSTQQ